MWNVIKSLALYMPRQIVFAFSYSKEVEKLAQRIENLKSDVKQVDDAEYCAAKGKLTAYFNSVSDKLPKDVHVDLVCHRDREAYRLDEHTRKSPYEGVCTASAQVPPMGGKSYAVIFNTEGFGAYDEQTHKAVLAHELSHVKNNDLAYMPKTMRQKALLNMGVMFSAGALVTGASPLLLGGFITARIAQSFIDKSVMRRLEFAADKGMVEYFNASSEAFGRYLYEEDENPIYEAQSLGRGGIVVKLLAALLTHPSHSERLKALGINSRP